MHLLILNLLYSKMYREATNTKDISKNQKSYGNLLL